MLNTDVFGRKTEITLVIKICKARDYCLSAAADTLFFEQLVHVLNDKHFFLLCFVV